MLLGFQAGITNGREENKMMMMMMMVMMMMMMKMKQHENNIIKKGKPESQNMKTTMQFLELGCLNVF